MGIKVHFNRDDEDIIRDGYEATHHRRYDEENHAIRYEMIPQYLRVGKKIRRRRAVTKLFEEWGGVLVWTIIIGGIVVWAFMPKHQSSSGTNYSHSSTSGIYQADSCKITTCNDGACSTSTGRGTCSHHGGVRD